MKEVIGSSQRQGKDLRTPKNSGGSGSATGSTKLSPIEEQLEALGVSLDVLSDVVSSLEKRLYSVSVGTSADNSTEKEASCPAESPVESCIRKYNKRVEEVGQQILRMTGALRT